jgi:3-oxoacyl-[acyl-carrier protein] reductase
MDEAEWDRVLDTNLKGVFLMCRETVPGMRERRWGRVITITSELGQSGSASGAHYAASKAGINAFTRSLAKEVGGDGVNVNCIAPGLTDTPMMRGANRPDYIAAVASESPGGRLGQPGDVVGLVAFLVSEGADHISGQVITMRG